MGSQPPPLPHVPQGPHNAQLCNCELQCDEIRDAKPMSNIVNS